MAAITQDAARLLAQQRAKEIQMFFEQDNEKRFQYIGLHGWGGQSSVHRVGYRGPCGPGAFDEQYLVMKTAGSSAKADLEAETNVLGMLQGCRHIVQMQNYYNDPLQSNQVKPDWAYVYLELLQNGTLDGFIQRFVEQKIDTKLPNRLLMQLFLCMIRACIAMAYPEGNSLDVNETIPGRGHTVNETSLIHNDIHGSNMMFQGLSTEIEHNTVPMLKVLDLGLATSGTGTPEAARQQNILDIGIMMATVMCLIQGRKYSGEIIEADLSLLRDDATRVETPASGILTDPDGISNTGDPLPRVDALLRLIVAACMASEPEQRPGLDELEYWVSNIILQWNDHTFADPAETNEGMADIVQRCIFNASVISTI